MRLTAEQFFESHKWVGRPYNMDVQVYDTGRSVPVDDKCFAFMFTNVGDSIAFVNGMVIFPSVTPLTSLGDSRSISGHDGDIYKGSINLRINTGGTLPQVEIVQLFYLD